MRRRETPGKGRSSSVRGQHRRYCDATRGKRGAFEMVCWGSACFLSHAQQSAETLGWVSTSLESREKSPKHYKWKSASRCSTSLFCCKCSQMVRRTIRDRPGSENTPTESYMMYRICDQISARKLVIRCSATSLPAMLAS